jgi:hypothetical protein
MRAQKHMSKSNPKFVAMQALLGFATPEANKQVMNKQGILARSTETSTTWGVSKVHSTDESALTFAKMFPKDVGVKEVEKDGVKLQVADYAIVREKREAAIEQFSQSAWAAVGKVQDANALIQSVTLTKSGKMVVRIIPRKVAAVAKLDPRKVEAWLMANPAEAAKFAAMLKPANVTE